MRRLRRVLVALIVFTAIYWLLVPSRGPSVESGSVLVLELSGDYVEAAEPPLVARLLGDRYQSFASLLSELRKASRDKRLAGVVLRIRNLGVGWAKAQEIRDEIKALRAAGMRAIAYLEVESTGSNLEYYVATSAEEVHVAPAAHVSLVGLAAEYLFLGGLWEKLGIELEVERIGRYKTAADVYAGTEMTEAFREMANDLLDSIDQQFVGGIAEGRGLEPDAVRRAIDAAPVSGEQMRALRLVDGVSFLDQVVARLGAGPVVQGRDYAAIDPRSLGIDPVARFALVYGTGAVTPGSGSLSPAGSPVLASDTVSKALRDAAEDPEIDAIIFRVDSPGGSPLAADSVWRATRRARESGKPLIASFSDVAASGGYYVAVGADAIVASPATLTGSIGVFLIRPVVRGLLDKLGIGVATLTRGRSADVLLASQALSPESRERLRQEVASIYELFVERVAEGRKLKLERVDALGRGRVWTGAQAAERGLVDAVGGLREAALRAKLALGLRPDADVALEPFPKPRSLAEQVEEALRRVSLASQPGLPLPRLARSLEQWLAGFADAAPGLVPPVLVEIH